jgi:hypothetical protein
MIECPSCKNQEFIGSVFCSECGARLTSLTTPGTLQVPRERVPPDQLVTRPAVPDGTELESGAVVGLRVVSSGDLLSLFGRDNYTLGRAIASQAVIPDVDLGPFHAHDHGVSRMHAELRVHPEGVRIVDLESANGTHLNGRKLEPQVPTPLRHGDVIQLGSLSLQLISRIR